MAFVYAAIGGLLAFASALPLVWKWGLPRRPASLALLALAALATAIVGLLATVADIGAAVTVLLAWLLALAFAAALLAQRFYRDPERASPERDDVVLSPADGEVVYVHESRGGALPVASKHGRDYRLEELTRTQLGDEDAVVVGISLSFLDVHVNRAPIGGEVTLQRRFPGRFASLRRPEAVFENERATTVIERDGIQVATVLIASRLVRRIVSYVAEGQSVALGQRIGVIRFGSQVDLVLPARAGLELSVRAGDRVTAGETVVAAFRPATIGESVGAVTSAP